MRFKKGDAMLLSIAIILLIIVLINSDNIKKGKLRDHPPKKYLEEDVLSHEYYLEDLESLEGASSQTASWKDAAWKAKLHIYNDGYLPLGFNSMEEYKKSPSYTKEVVWERIAPENFQEEIEKLSIPKKSSLKHENCESSDVFCYYSEYGILKNVVERFFRMTPCPSTNSIELHGDFFTDKRTDECGYGLLSREFLKKSGKRYVTDQERWTNYCSSLESRMDAIVDRYCILALSEIRQNRRELGFNPKALYASDFRQESYDLANQILKGAAENQFLTKSQKERQTLSAKADLLNLESLDRRMKRLDLHPDVFVYTNKKPSKHCDRSFS